jgi:hypothetical protein
MKVAVLRSRWAAWVLIALLAALPMRGFAGAAMPLAMGGMPSTIAHAAAHDPAQDGVEASQAAVNDASQPCHAGFLAFGGHADGKAHGANCAWCVVVCAPAMAPPLLRAASPPAGAEAQVARPGILAAPEGVRDGPFRPPRA